ncbi:unnamed protein product, partial [Pylaiella littoralis]
FPTIVHLRRRRRVCAFLFFGYPLWGGGILQKCTSALWWWVELLLLVLIGWVGGQFPLFVLITRERCDGVCACLFFLYVCSVGRVNLRARWCARAVGSIFICFWNEFG